jgi:hypothetical protein
MTGSTGRDRGRRSRGRGGRATCSPSPEEEECPHDKYFKFVALINDDPFGKKKLPDKFVEFLADREPTEVILREASCDFCRSTVELVRRGRQDVPPHLLEEARMRARRRGRLPDELLLRRTTT